MTWQPAYSPEDDARINSMRLAGHTWSAIAIALGKKAELGAGVHKRAKYQQMPCVSMADQPEIKHEQTETAGSRAPLPAYDAITWGAIDPPARDGFMEPVRARHEG